ncbi:MAG: methyltransferase domain-containing protein [Acidobacteria bacterium]|jgi:demethylmenaquinone methyltransferase/2-methoxy-6-polyprenyl-1,4-benzoquinol methylase|nr:MAG: methyltransferase domain-containing protein [Acidobacteriota bacterium]
MISKKTVADVFSAVSRKYDLFLRLVTFGGIDIWQEELLSMSEGEAIHLDVGTGTGEVLLKSKSGLRVGIDLSLDMLKVAKNKCPRCAFILADAENIPFKDESFELITLSLVYRHLLNREDFLKEARRLLKEGGELCLLDINRFSLTPFLIFLMKYPLKPLGLLLFGSERWDFFIHSLENSISVEKVQLELKTHGFETKVLKRRVLGLVYILCAYKNIGTS